MYLFKKKQLESSYVPSGMNGSTRGQSAGGKERCLFESHGLLRPQSLFESILSSLPAGFQFRQQRLPLVTERPVTLPAVITNSVACEAAFFISANVRVAVVWSIPRASASSVVVRFGAESRSCNAVNCVAWRPVWASMFS
jgi:hypothetical protein